MKDWILPDEEKRFYGKILILRIRFYKAADNIVFGAAADCSYRAEQIKAVRFCAYVGRCTVFGQGHV